MSKIKLKYNHQKNRDTTLRSISRVSDHRRELSDLVFRVAEAKSVKALVQRRTQVQGRISKMLGEIAALRDCFDQQIGDKTMDYSEREALEAAEADERRADREAAKSKKEAEKAEAAKAKAKKLKAQAKKSGKTKTKAKKADPAILAHAMNGNAPWPHPAESTALTVSSLPSIKSPAPKADAQPKSKGKKTPLRNTSHPFFTPET